MKWLNCGDVVRVNKFQTQDSYFVFFYKLFWFILTVALKYLLTLIPLIPVWKIKVLMCSARRSNKNSKIRTHILLYSKLFQFISTVIFKILSEMIKFRRWHFQLYSTGIVIWKSRKYFKQNTHQIFWGCLLLPVRTC